MWLNWNTWEKHREKEKKGKAEKKYKKMKDSVLDYRFEHLQLQNKKTISL